MFLRTEYTEELMIVYSGEEKEKGYLFDQNFDIAANESIILVQNVLRFRL